MPRCSELGCPNQSQSGGHCIKHGGGLRCLNCVNTIDSRRANPEYDGFCATCFKQLFPDEPRVKTYGFKELQTRTFMEKHFQDFCHNTPIYTAHCDCTHRRRIDHRLCIDNTLICVETDERAHAGYSAEDENYRYHDVIMNWGGKLVFIRFNPDCKKVSMEDKFARLAAEINAQVRRVRAGENTELLERVYLFYPQRSRLMAPF